MKRWLPVCESKHTDYRMLHKLLEPPVNSVTGFLLFSEVFQTPAIHFENYQIINLVSLVHCML
jgi:hypothetical protein